jgi:hypothetical protein
MSEKLGLLRASTKRGRSQIREFMAAGHIPIPAGEDRDIYNGPAWPHCLSANGLQRTVCAV